MTLPYRLRAFSLRLRLSFLKTNCNSIHPLTHVSEQGKLPSSWSPFPFGCHFLSSEAGPSGHVAEELHLDAAHRVA